MTECCCSGTGGGVCTVPIHVKCGSTTSAAVGVSVSLSLTGQPTITHTTDGSGNATFALTAFGVWTITVAPSTGYAGSTTTINASSFICAGGTWPGTWNVSDPAATGYDCNPPGCTTATGCVAGPPYLISAGAYATTAYLTDDYGVITLTSGTYGFSGGAALSYIGSATRTASGAYTGPCSALVGAISPTSVTVFFEVWCDGRAGADWWCVAAVEGTEIPCGAGGACSSGLPYADPTPDGTKSGGGCSSSSQRNNYSQQSDPAVTNPDCPPAVSTSFTMIFTADGSCGPGCSLTYALNKIYSVGSHTWGFST